MSVNQRKCRNLVQARVPFKGHGSLYGRKVGSKGYGVFSYGEHWPLHVWDGAQWHHNGEKYSPTTSKQYGQSHPSDSPEGPHLSCAEIKALVARLDSE